MLVVTKSYTVIYIDLFKFFGLLSLTVLVIAVGAAYLIEIPNYISLALSIPFGILSTSIWELAIKKSNKVFDDEAIGLFLTRLLEKDIFFCDTFTWSFLSKRNQNKLVVNLSNSSILDEITVISHFIQTAFQERYRQLGKHSEIKMLFDKIMRKDRMLEKRFGVNFNNLAFLYEQNVNYLFNYYKIGHSIALKYNISDSKLLVEKSLLTNALFDPKKGFIISKEFCDHPYKTRYANLAKEIFYNYSYVGSTQVDTDVVFNALNDLHSLLYEIEKIPEFKVLFINIIIDILDLISDEDLMGKRGNERILKSEAVESLSELRLKFDNKLKAHPPIYFLYRSRLDYSYFKNSFEEFEFSDEYNNLLRTIYQNAMDEYILQLDASGFISAYTGYISKKFENSSAFWLQVYTKFYNYFLNGESLNFSDIHNPRLSTEDFRFDQLFCQNHDYYHSLLKTIDFSNVAQVQAGFREVFRPAFGVFDFKSNIIYNHQPLDKFANYVFDEAFE